MLISYWTCPYRDYDDTCKSELEDFYLCNYPKNNDAGLCILDNKQGSTDDCIYLDIPLND